MQWGRLQCGKPTCLGEPQKASQRIYKVTLDLTFKEKVSSFGMEVGPETLSGRGGSRGKEIRGTGLHMKPENSCEWSVLIG